MRNMSDDLSITYSKDNETFLEEEIKMFERMKLHATIISTFSIITTLLGNAFLIFFLFYNKYKKKGRKFRSHHTLIIHMCVSNLCYAIFSILPTLLFTIHLYDFDLPLYVCKLYKYLSIIPMYASPFLLVATSVDRYYAICKPMERLKYKFYTTAKFFALSAWIFAFICSIPNLIIWERTVMGSCEVPLNNAWISKLNILFFSTVAWILPCILVAVLFYFVYRVAYRTKTTGSSDYQRLSTIQKKKYKWIYLNFFYNIFKKSSILSCFKTQKKESYIISYVFKGSKKIKNDDIAKKKKETLKLTITIVIVSFLMYSPFAIVNLMDFFNFKFGDGRLLTYILFLGNLNTCSSPIIYLYTHAKKVKNVQNSNTSRLVFDF
ncbi:G protein-coupled receptor, rhodopsin-like family and GPCR, rhodopsin-like, 7TM domain-containing protein [Strongyloides ratti]|uniref:G protein-coupled receptor, rhodopsin-like family and GPCR, rhodopsin-like, 7TM domain-containing protein n=1 Tax=Strongyloides ratti TaxID=34506 RepID=A0A090LQH9_STRRB|nr:G protein-coupled receptor, rhodopsin-like family and GPCR, rhodopsin-like, 7TM domain-containing protein [Strongyloides ratti]CEF69821.1 G protein-coupled receptor, rhodopsin-like family and GPCR, rhodopsin-like, 7TM domain-containing protein [Strongyloides ratti]